MSFVWFWLLPLLLTRVDSQALKGCESQCGEVNITYPFGDIRCAKNSSFVVECRNHTTGSKPYHIDREIVSIDLRQGEITLINNISTRCVKRESEKSVDISEEILGISFFGTPFTFSTRNKLTAIGCATIVFLANGTGRKTTTACSSLCNPNLKYARDDICTGIGCCQTSINKGLKFFNVSFQTFYAKLGVEDENPCSRAFLVEENTFQFKTSFLSIEEDLPLRVQMVLDFAVDGCGRNNIEKVSSTGVGHLCSCRSGYEGNPYMTDDCKDIDECKQGNNPCSKDCINTPGSYKCTDESKNLIAIISGLSGGIFLLLFGGSSVLFYKKSKKIQKKKLRKKNFNQNYILLEQTSMSSHEETVERTKFFTLKELEKATNNFDKARIIGEGGQGTVYKGLLLDQRVAAIKTSKVMNQKTREDFINEVALISRIYHRNVVKLLGCCLESEMPLLVYEFISHGTLSDQLHVPDHSSDLCWEDRLRIAIEVASAIVYLLSASSNTIFHMDLKSANILLDEKLTAKLSDFGASRSISSDQIDVTATVQGTFGYIDPEYFLTRKLTQKTDVYSLGAILVELVTGQKLVSNEGESVIIQFKYLLKVNQVHQIFDRSIVEESEKEELEVVARLAGDCLRSRGEDRPTMKEIESTLEGIRRSKKKKKRKINRNEKTSCEIEMVGGSETRSSIATHNSQSFNSSVDF